MVNDLIKGEITMKRYMHGELAPDVAKKPNEPMQ